MTRTRKSIAAALAAVTLGAAVSVAATPASAWGWRHHRHYGWGAPVAVGVLGALTVGAIAASAADSYDTCLVRQRVYNDDGYFIGWRRARVPC